MSKSRFALLFGLLLVVAMVLAACPAAAPAPAAGDESAAAEATEPAAEEAPAEGGAASDEVVEIEYWQYNFGGRIEAMDDLIAQFEAENPNIKVIHNSDIPYDNFRDQIAASVPAGVGPDVATLFYGWQPAWVDAGFIVPLPEDDFPPEMVAEQFSPMVQASFFEGKLYTLPTAVPRLRVARLAARAVDDPAMQALGHLLVLADAAQDAEDAAVRASLHAAVPEYRPAGDAPR